MARFLLDSIQSYFASQKILSNTQHRDGHSNLAGSRELSKDSQMMQKDISLSAVIAGFVAVLVGFTSSVASIYQATQNLSATPAQTASWIWALGLGMDVTSIVLSWKYRMPILVAWSTPGSAVIASAAAGGHLTLREATGTFMVCAVMICVAGFSGGFEKIMKRLPLPLPLACQQVFSTA